jgi:hypothetical protein
MSVHTIEVGPAVAMAPPVAMPKGREMKKVKKAKPNASAQPPLPAASKAGPQASALSVSPDNGSGYTQAFRFQYTDANGAGDIAAAEIRFEQDGRACAILAEPGTRQVSLQYQPDRGPRLRVSGSAGSLTQLESPVCVIDLSGASFQADGNNLEVALPVTFKPSFDGPKEVLSWPWDKTGRRGPGATAGHWMVGPRPPGL